MQAAACDADLRSHVEFHFGELLRKVVEFICVSALAGMEVRHHAGNRIELFKGELKGVCVNLSLGWRVGQLVPSNAAGVGGGVGTVREATGRRDTGSAGTGRRRRGSFYRRILLDGGGVTVVVMFVLRFPAPH